MATSKNINKGRTVIIVGHRQSVRAGSKGTESVGKQCMVNKAGSREL